MKYKAVKNPQLLTLVNPGKPPRKKRAAKSTGGRKVTKAQRRAIALKNLKKAHAARRRPSKARKPRRKVGRRNPTAAQLANLAKGRAKLAAKRRKAGAHKSAGIKRQSKPSTRITSLTKPKISNRKARTRRASRLGVAKQGWYPKSVKTGKSRRSVKRSWQWVGNAAKKRRRTGKRRQTAAQRRASLRNLAKARRAQGGRKYRRNAAPKRRRRSTSKRSIRRTGVKRPVRRTRRRRGYRRNSGMMARIMNYVKPALAGGVGFFGSRLAGNFVSQQTYVVIPETLRPYAPLAANILVAVSAPTIMNKLAKNFKPLAGIVKYKEAVVVGALVAAVENVATMLLPASAQAYVAPPLGMGDALSVYERALSGYSGRGMGYPGLGSSSLRSILAADDGVGEYIAEPGVGEYITEPGMGEYIAEPGMGVDVSEAFAGMGEYISEPGMGLDVEEAFAGDYDLAGVSIEEAVAGLYGYDVQADEGLANHIFGNDSGGGLFGETAAEAPGPAVRKVANTAALSAMSKGASKTQAARASYSAVKAAMGLPAGNAQLRDAVVSAVDRVFATGGGSALVARGVPMAPPSYSETSTDYPIDGAPGPVEPIGSDEYEPFGEPTPIADQYVARVGGIFKGSLYSN